MICTVQIVSIKAWALLLCLVFHDIESDLIELTWYRILTFDISIVINQYKFQSKWKKNWSDLDRYRNISILSQSLIRYWLIDRPRSKWSRSDSFNIEFIIFDIKFRFHSLWQCFRLKHFFITLNWRWWPLSTKTETRCCSWAPSSSSRRGPYAISSRGQQPTFALFKN